MKEKNTKELNEVLGKTNLSDFEKYCAENKAVSYTHLTLPTKA